MELLNCASSPTIDVFQGSTLASVLIEDHIHIGTVLCFPTGSTGAQLGSSPLIRFEVAQHSTDPRRRCVSQRKHQIRCTRQAHILPLRSLRGALDRVSNAHPTSRCLARPNLPRAKSCVTPPSLPYYLYSTTDCRRHQMRRGPRKHVHALPPLTPAGPRSSGSAGIARMPSRSTHLRDDNLLLHRRTTTC